MVRFLVQHVFPDDDGLLVCERHSALCHRFPLMFTRQCKVRSGVVRMALDTMSPKEQSDSLELSNHMREANAAFPVALHGA